MVRTRVGGNVTRAEFERMWAEGILDPEKRFDLVRGEIVVLTPEGSRHVNAVLGVIDALRSAYGPGFHLRAGNPLAIAPDDREGDPQPDVAVVEGSRKDYKDAHPRTAVLVVEVSDTTLRDDRTRKASIYARAKVPEYWIVNLVSNQLEVHRSPRRTASAQFGWAYRDVERRPFGVVRPPRGKGEVDLSDVV